MRGSRTSIDGFVGACVCKVVCASHTISHSQVEQIKIPLLGIFGALDSHKGFSDEAVSDTHTHAHVHAHAQTQVLATFTVRMLVRVRKSCMYLKTQMLLHTHTHVCVCVCVWVCMYVQTARATAEKIKAAGGDITLEVYPSGVHGFLNQLILPEGPTLTKG